LRAKEPSIAFRLPRRLNQLYIVAEWGAGSAAERNEIQSEGGNSEVSRRTASSAGGYHNALKAACPQEGVFIRLIGEKRRRFEVLKDSGD